MYLYLCVDPLWPKDFQAKGLCMIGTREVHESYSIFILTKYILYIHQIAPFYLICSLKGQLASECVDGWVGGFMGSYSLSWQ